MFESCRKPATVFLSVSVVLLLSACQTNVAKNPSQQESSESASIEQSITEQTAASTSDAIEQIAVYAGPGTDYLSLGTIDKNIIEKAIKVESDWAEIEYAENRGYVPQKDVSELCTDNVIRLVDKLEENTQSYPVYEKVNTKVTLLNETMTYNHPRKSGTSAFAF